MKRKRRNKKNEISDDKTDKDVPNDNNLGENQETLAESNKDVSNNNNFEQNQETSEVDKDVPNNNNLEQNQETPESEPGISQKPKKKNHTCTKCYETFETLYRMRCHRIGCSKNEQRHKCSHCDRSFPRLFQLKVCSLLFS